MTIKNWLNQSTKILEESQISTARLDSIILLEDTLGKDRSWLLAHDDEEINQKIVSKLNKQIERRRKYEPLAYIREKCEFYGHEFIISPATLQPRSETETMITIAKDLIETNLSKTARVIDVGTGSGAIAVSIKLEIPDLNVLATDIQPEALIIARQNADKLKVNIDFYEGDLLLPVIDQSFEVVLTNLPYVPLNHTINESAMHEPAVAIFGGEDGLDLYRQLFEQMSLFSKKPKFILTECLPFQHKVLAEIATKCGYNLNKTEDFIQTFSLQKS